VVTICTTSLTFSNSTFFPQSVFTCFVWIWQQTAVISLYSINWLVFKTEMKSVYSAVRTGSLYIIRVNISLKMVKHVQFRLRVVSVATRLHSGNICYRSYYRPLPSRLLSNSWRLKHSELSLCYTGWLKSPCAILRSAVRVRMEVMVHERVPGDRVLKVRQRYNLRTDECNLTWYLDKMPYPLPAPCTAIRSKVHRDFSLTLYVRERRCSIEREENLQRVFESREVRETCVPKEDQVQGDWEDTE
jgi:hypothetical protein